MATLSKLDKLTYSIGIIDKVTGPVNKVMAKINQLSQQTAAAQDQMMRGGATAVGGGYALAKSLAPAIDQVAALGEVQSVGALSDALDELNGKGLQFISEFGGKAPDFVRSAYKIQQAVKPIGGEFAEITRLSNLTAVALRTDANTVSDTFGKIYNSNKEYADKVGKVNFFSEIAGKMAYMQGSFSMEGKDLNAALSKLGSKATAKGVDLNEQLAVIGVLKDYTKSGSAAMGVYGGFLDKIGTAEKALDIDFYQNGKLLETDKIIQKINSKLEGATKSQRENILDKVFGASGRGLVDHLTTQIGRVTSETKKLTQIKDHGEAEKLAKIIASPWDRLGGSFNAAATAMGSRLLPVVEPFVELLAVGFAGIVSLTERFPILSSVIATLVVGIVALISIYGVVMFTMGLYKMALVTSGALTMGLTVITKLWQGALIALRVLGFLSLIATVGAAAIAFGAFKGVMLAGQAATWLFNAALWANPITWIVAGVIALVAAVGALIYFWDDLVAAFQNTAWGNALMQIFAGVKAAFNSVIDSVKWVLEKLGLIDDTEAKIKTEALTTHENINRAQPKNLVMQNTDQAFSRDYGQSVINKAAQEPISSTNDFTNAANSPVFSRTQTQLTSINTSIGQSNALPTAKTDQAITNLANTSAYKVEQLSTEQQQNSSYKAKVQKSAFLQNLTNNSNSTKNNNQSDHSKRVYIDNLTVKSDDPINSIEQLMELAG
ncbi:phage tail tape measure protein [Pseudoalteromonas issachenkonii]|uniref:Phage tail tape measure protein n=1 Tax=Pseudoalteromonas issachenkonii TaxID=152297 RepID=A0ABU9H1M6_9GAMM